MTQEYDRHWLYAVSHDALKLRDEIISSRWRNLTVLVGAIPSGISPKRSQNVRKWEAEGASNVLDVVHRGDRRILRNASGLHCSLLIAF